MFLFSTISKIKYIAITILLILISIFSLNPTPAFANTADSKMYFSDVKTSDWFYEAINWAYDNKLITGYSGTKKFAPNEALTRGQAAVILWRYFEPRSSSNYKQANAKNTTRFTDNLDGQYYTEAINWAYKNNIFMGYSGTTIFGVNEPLTRRQMCITMYRCAVTLCNTSSICSWKKYNTYPDKEKFDYSEPTFISIAWCLDKKVIAGWDKKYIAASMTIDRAQMAQIMMNSVQNKIISNKNKNIIKISNNSYCKCSCDLIFNSDQYNLFYNHLDEIALNCIENHKASDFCEGFCEFFHHWTILYR